MLHQSSFQECLQGCDLVCRVLAYQFYWLKTYPAATLGAYFVIKLHHPSVGSTPEELLPIALSKEKETKELCDRYHLFLLDIFDTDQATASAACFSEVSIPYHLTQQLE